MIKIIIEDINFKSHSYDEQKYKTKFTYKTLDSFLEDLHLLECVRANIDGGYVEPIFNMNHTIDDKMFILTFIKDGVDLAGIDLSSKAISDAIFLNANLNGAKFNKSLLVKCKFINCDLTNANFCGANVSFCDVIVSRSTKLNFVWTHFLDCEFLNSKFENADFSNSNFYNCRLWDCQIIKSDFNNAFFCKESLMSSLFLSCSFEKAKFQEINDSWTSSLKLIDCHLSNLYIQSSNEQCLKSLCSCINESNDIKILTKYNSKGGYTNIDDYKDVDEIPSSKFSRNYKYTNIYDD